jgi:hypothetical protein
MTTIDTLADIAKIEETEDTLYTVLRDLEHAVDERTPPDRKYDIDLQEIVEDLSDALDCLQIGLGRPYVWMLTRR